MIATLSEESVSTIDDILTAAEIHCLQQGSKLTEKRKSVLSVLIKVNKAISAYELIDLLEQSSQRKIPPMSAYRILDYLESVNLVHKIHVANKFVACSHIGCQEEHVAQLLFCQQCHRVEEKEINTSVVQSLNDEVKQSGFELCSQHIELACLCRTCSDNQPSTQQPPPAENVCN